MVESNSNSNSDNGQFYTVHHTRTPPPPQRRQSLRVGQRLSRQQTSTRPPQQTTTTTTRRRGPGRPPLKTIKKIQGKNVTGTVRRNSLKKILAGRNVLAEAIPKAKYKKVVAEIPKKRMNFNSKGKEKRSKAKTLAWKSTFAAEKLRKKRNMDAFMKRVKARQLEDAKKEVEKAEKMRDEAKKKREDAEKVMENMREALKKGLKNAAERGDKTKFDQLWNSIPLSQREGYKNFVAPLLRKMPNKPLVVKMKQKVGGNGNSKNNLNANEARLKNKYGTRTVQKVKRKMLKNKVQNAKENRQLTEFKYNLAKPLKIKVSAKKSNNEASLRNVYGDKMVQKVKRNILKNKVRNAKELATYAKENRQLTEFKYNLAKPLKIKVSAEKVKDVKSATDQKELKRRKAKDKRNLIKNLTNKVRWHPPRSLLQFGNLVYNQATLRVLQERGNSAYGKNTPEAERVKIYERWFRQLKTLMGKKPIHDLGALKYGWVNSVIAKMNAEKKAKDNAKAKEKANEIARKEERKRERDEKRKKKENEKRVKNAIAGLKKLRKN